MISPKFSAAGSPLNAAVMSVAKMRLISGSLATNCITIASALARASLQGAQQQSSSVSGLLKHNPAVTCSTNKL